MTSSKLRSRDRKQLRRQAHAAIAEVPTKFVLEVLAARLRIADGRLEVRFRDGFLVDVTTSRKLEIPHGSPTETRAQALAQALQEAAELGRTG